MIAVISLLYTASLKHTLFVCNNIDTFLFATITALWFMHNSQTVSLNGFLVRLVWHTKRVNLTTIQALLSYNYMYNVIDIYDTM